MSSIEKSILTINGVHRALSLRYLRQISLYAYF
jgi:hypothetical protein